MTTHFKYLDLKKNSFWCRAFCSEEATQQHIAEFSELKIKSENKESKYELLFKRNVKEKFNIKTIF